MLSEIDSILFSDDCEVVEIPLHNQWVYLIQKNGTSSLQNLQKKYNLNLLTNEQIRQLDFVDVYIRDAQDRYVSGINTYLQYLKRDHPELDQPTAFWFAKQYKFLNYKGFRILHPDIQRLDLHKAFCFPFNNPPMEDIFNRWEKDIYRFNLYEKYYPIQYNNLIDYEAKYYKFTLPDKFNSIKSLKL